VCFLKAQIREGLASVCGSVDAIAPAHAVAHIGFPGPHPDDIRILLEQPHGTYGTGAVVIEDRFPGGPGVEGLPDTAGGGCHDHDTEVCIQGLDIGDPASHVGRSYVAPLEILQESVL